MYTGRRTARIEALRECLQVARAPQRGYMLTIAVTSPDPAEAARLANAVAETYLVDKLDARLGLAKRASVGLGDRLVGLRAQLREFEDAVARFRADHRLVQSGGATLSQQQLSELNLTLIQARADLAQKKARVDLLNSLQGRGGSIANMPDIAKASTCETLRKDQANISAQEADLLARYNRSHPLVVNIRAQLQDVERFINSETARLAAGIRNEYELARARVASLEQNVQQATGQSNQDDATTVRLRELERTAAVNKTLFEDFLKQAKVTEQQSTFEPQDVRIITPGARTRHAELSEQDAVSRRHTAGRLALRRWRRGRQGQAQFRVYDAEAGRGVPGPAVADIGGTREFARSVGGRGQYPGPRDPDTQAVVPL